MKIEIIMRIMRIMEDRVNKHANFNIIFSTPTRFSKITQIIMIFSKELYKKMEESTLKIGMISSETLFIKDLGKTDFPMDMAWFIHGPNRPLYV